MEVELMSTDNYEPSIQEVFKEYSQAYDLINDKYERIVKISRDITIQSKRMIFLLHRSPINKIESDINKALETIKTHFRAIEKELEGEDHLKFDRAFTPGMQEFIEAVSLLHYLKEGELISITHIEDLVDLKNVLRISFKNYILGLTDLTGELMRICIKDASFRNIDRCKQIRDFVRNLYNNFMNLKFDDFEFPKKMSTMKQSLIKIENTCFALIVRNSEFPDAPISLDVFNDNVHDE